MKGSIEMGGNALKKVKTRRYNKEEIDIASNEIISKLETVLDTRVFSTKEYKNKESFGDLDVLVEIDGNKEQTLNRIFSILTFQEKADNGNVVSINYNDLQLDLILTEPENFDFAKVYFSFNDLGLFIGRLARLVGLVFGSDGLKIRVESHFKHGNLGDAFITKNPQEAFDILDLDWKKYELGFDTIKDVFLFVSDSIYFSEDITKRGTGRSDKRDKKRRNYLLFEQWIEDNKNKNNWTDYFNKNVSKEKMINNFRKKYPDFNNQIEYLHQKDAEKEEDKKIFNGTMVMEKYLNLSSPKLGNLLGNFYVYFKEKYKGTRFSDFGKEKMMELFDNYFEENYWA